jgi:hypothetical protein
MAPDVLAFEADLRARLGEGGQPDGPDRQPSPGR